jgi:signal transduction histidine kinase
MAVEVTVAGELDELDRHVEQAVYRIADEALTNAARHSSASRAEVELRRRGPSLELTVSDDGVGFDVTAGTPNGHHGLIGMSERAAMVGGELVVESRPGGGTTIRFVAEVPP